MHDCESVTAVACPMNDIKAILAATMAAFVLPPPSLTMYPSIDGLNEGILPTTLGILSQATPESNGRSRPGQEGKRISQFQLESLSDQECLWHFRCILWFIYLQPEDIHLYTTGLQQMN